MAQLNNKLIKTTLVGSTFPEINKKLGEYLIDFSDKIVTYGKPKKHVLDGVITFTCKIYSIDNLILDKIKLVSIGKRNHSPKVSITKPLQFSSDYFIVSLVGTPDMDKTEFKKYVDVFCKRSDIKDVKVQPFPDFNELKYKSAIDKITNGNSNSFDINSGIDKELSCMITYKLADGITHDSEYIFMINL